MLTKWQRKMIKSFTDELGRPSKWDHGSRLAGLFVILVAVAWAVFMIIR